MVFCTVVHMNGDKGSFGNFVPLCTLDLSDCQVLFQEVAKVATPTQLNFNHRKE